MEIFKYIFDIAAFSVTVFFLFNGCIEFRRNKMWFIYFIYFFLFCFPVAFNYFLKAYYYSGYWYGYSVIQDDVLTCVIYDIVIIAIAIASYFIIEHYKVDETTIDDSHSFFKKKIVVCGLYAFAVAPILLFFLFSIVGKYNPFIIFKFGWRYTYERQQWDYVGYGAVERLTYISIVSVALLISNLNFKRMFSFKNESKSYIIFNVCKLLGLIICFALAILIQGKRSIFLYSALVTAITLSFKFMRNKKFWISLIALAFVISVVVFVCIYLAKEYRISGGEFGPQSYTALRVDLFRDQSLKFAIYSAIHSKEIRIVSFPGQSYLTEIFYLFPIVYLPISFKRGYETYFTASEMLAPISYLDAGRLTNSGIDELVANFSFFGILIYLVLFWLFVRRLSKSSSDTKIVLIVGFVLFLMYTTSYICWYFEILLIAYICDRFIKYLNRRRALHGKEA